MTAPGKDRSDKTVSQFPTKALPPPDYEVPVWGSTECRYSTGAGRTDDPGHPRGVYMKRGPQWVMVGPLPYVLEVIRHQDGAGRWTHRSYRLAMRQRPLAAEVTLVNEEEIDQGGWASALGVPLARDPKIRQAVATAIIAHAKQNNAPVSRAVPTWLGNTLALPAPDVGPAGYGVCAPVPEPDARAAWAEVLTLCGKAPKLALVAGLSLGGLFVRPLGRQSFVTLLSGSGGKGKTTALMVAAALYGRCTKEDGSLIRPWSASAIGLIQEAAQHAMLPMFRDEAAAAGLDGRKLESFILALTNGAQRTVGGKTGSARTSGAWHGALIATSNDSILGQVANEGVTRRLLEFDTPITNDHESAERIKVLTESAYGWPLHWLRAAGVGPNEFRERVSTAETALELPTESVPRSLGQHLALGVAGAAALDELVNGPDAGALHAAALDVARLLLVQLTREARERGITPGERLLSAVLDAMASRPQNFPGREYYRATLAGDNQFSRLDTREVEGWDLTEDDGIEGHLAVLSTRLDAICADAGITNSRVGLRELDRAGAAGRPGVLRSKDTEGQLVQRLRVGPREHHRPGVYVFRLDEESRSRGGSQSDDKGSESGDNGDNEQDTGDNPPTSENDEQGTLDLSPASPVDKGTGDATGDTVNEALTSTDTPSKGSLVPGVPGFSEQPRMREGTGAEPAEDDGPEPVDEHGLWGPVWRDVELGQTVTPCRICGQGAVSFRDQLGPVHPFTCARGQTPAPAPDPVSGPESAPEPSSRPGRVVGQGRASDKPDTAAEGDLSGFEAVLAVDDAGVWLPGQAEPVALDEPLVNGDAVYRLLARHGARVLFVHPTAEKAMGELPPVAVGGVRAGDAERAAGCSWVADCSEVQLDLTGPWVALLPNDRELPRRAVVFTAAETRIEFAEASSGRELLEAVRTLNRTIDQQLGKLTSGDRRRRVPYYLSPNLTGADLVRACLPATHTDAGEWVATPIDLDDVPPVAGRGGAARPAARWARPGGLLDEEDVPGVPMWVHKYDKNGAEPGTVGALTLAHGGPEGGFVHQVNPSLERVGQTEAYYLTQLDRKAPTKLDPLLPDLLAPWRKLDALPSTAGQPVWLPGDWLAELLGNAPVSVLEAYVARRATNWLKPFGQVYSGGRTVLKKAAKGHQDGCGCRHCVALAGFITIFRSRIGDFDPTGDRSAFIPRPDVRDMIKTRTHMNQYRTLRKIAQQSGRYPWAYDVDAVFYISDNPDPEKAAPAGLKLGTALGCWKPQGSVLLAAIRDVDGWEIGTKRIRIWEDAYTGGRS